MKKSIARRRPARLTAAGTAAKKTARRKPAPRRRPPAVAEAATDEPAPVAGLVLLPDRATPADDAGLDLAELHGPRPWYRRLLDWLDRHF